jgi:hypothetical protein
MPARPHKYDVFLSYSSADKSVAAEIASYLGKEGARLWLDDWELKPGDSIVERVNEALETSAYLVVLLSPSSVSSPWVKQEWNAALARELNERRVTVLPVLVQDCVLPGVFQNLVVLDLRSDRKEKMERLAERLGLAPSIDFGRLDGRQFEAMVGDLLQRLEFHDLRHDWRSRGLQFDIRASFTASDPFGGTVEQTWLVETKLYKSGRADLATLNRMVGHLRNLPEHHRGLLVTNGQLTSAAASWLESETAEQRVGLRVIDGTELQGLLLKEPSIVRKYFPSKSPADD